MNLFGENEVDSPTYSKWNLEVAPQLTWPLLPPSERKIVIDQNHKGFGELGSRVWDGGLVLCRYLESLGADFFKGKKTIELGSGTGLPSILIAMMKGDVTATDRKSLLKLIEHNGEQNLTKEELTNLHTAELLWGTGNPFSHKFDIIVGADLTYEFEDLPPLISTLKDLTSDDSIVFIAYGKERAAAPNFLELAGEHFEVSNVEDDKLNTCDIKFPTFSIGIVKLKKKKQQK